MNFFWKVVDLIDIFPGLKTNIGSAGVVLSYALAMVGVAEVYRGPLTDLCVAFITFAFAMKGLRTINPLSTKK